VEEDIVDRCPEKIAEALGEVVLVAALRISWSHWKIQSKWFVYQA
jgi:hypothetical protein